MSLIRLQQRLIATNFLHFRAFAKDATKPSTAPIPDQSIPSINNPINIEDDPLKVTVTKSNLDSVVLKDNVKPANIVVDEITKSISFEDIPGPKILRYVAKLWSTLPVLGTQVTGNAIQYLLSIGSQLSWGGNLWIFKKLMDEYGPVVRLYGPFGGDVVIISRPEHVAAVYKNEGPYPIRSSLDSVERYRLQHRKLKNCGPFLMFGPEWEKFRKSMEQHLSLSLNNQFNKIEDSSERFVARIKTTRNRQDEMGATFYKEICKWSLECLCLVILNKRLGFLDQCGVSTSSDPGVLLESFLGASDAIRRCEYGLHLWKFIKTPAWNSLVEHCEALENVFTRHINRVQTEIREKKDSQKVQTTDYGLLEALLVKYGIIPNDALTILLDILLIGTNATSHSVAFLFYHLARYPKCQVKLYNEIKSVKLNKDNLMRLPYLQACIKESLRLKPPVPVIGRILPNDISVHNYHIPKGTYLLMATGLSSLREEYFEDAHKFIPERWLQQGEDIPLFASIPFGYGAKACLAKELAEMEISVLITKILKAYRIEYLYGDIQSTNRLLAEPNKTLRFRFVDRSN